MTAIPRFIGNVIARLISLAVGAALIVLLLFVLTVGAIANMIG